MRSGAATGKAENLMVRVDRASKDVISRAARLRGVSASDYVRSVVVRQARRDVEEARTHTIVLDPEQQFAFWSALSMPERPTSAQRKLGKVMRGER